MNKKAKAASLLFVIGFLFCCSLCLANSPNSSIISPPAKQTELSSGGFQRLDFRIEGKSCAACLLSIQRKLNSLPGVKEAVVMLKRPFGVSVIYRESKIKQVEILTVVKDKEPNIRVVEINDTSISKVPSPLIPPFVPIQESNH